MDIILPKSVIIIDDDESIRNAVTRGLRNAGIRKVVAFENSSVAWEAANKSKYQLIILDWNLPEISGVGMFNRFRNHKAYKRIPIIVITGFLDKKNLAILEEFPFSRALQKPFETNFLLKNISELLEEQNWVERQERKLQTLINQVKSKQLGALVNLRALIIESQNHKVSIMAGKIFYDHGMHEEAEEMFKLALKQKDTSIMALNELGKLYLESGNIKACKRLLEKANNVNVDNIERLCNLGSISLNQMDFDKANQYFADALSIDGKNIKAKSGQKLITNISAYLEHVSSIPESLSSLLNTVGVNMVRQKKVGDGIRHYNAALMHVTANDTRSRLAFNIGYAYRRSHDPQAASQWFEKSLELDPTYEKVKKYIDDDIVQAILQDGKAPKREQPAPIHEEQADVDIDLDMDMDIDMEDMSDAVQVENQLGENGHTFGEHDIGHEVAPQAVERQDFAKVCPIIDDYLEMASEQGMYLETQMQELYDLYLMHGSSFDEALAQMIKEENPSINILKNLLQEAS